MKAFLLKPVLWWAIAGSCAAVGGTVYVVHKQTAEPTVATVGTPTTILGATTVDTSVDKNGSTTVFGQVTTTVKVDTRVDTTTVTVGPLPSLTIPTIPPLTSPTIPEPTLPPPLACPPCPIGYSVLAATTVTNTGPTSVSGGVGLWPGTAVTGFPPGIAVVDAASPAANAAQIALTADYLDAMLRPSTTVNAQLGGLVVAPGVYSGPAHMALDLTGTLTLDGPGVYIFQTDSTLITASGSRVELINGARACDVFWQVGSSATLGTGSEFAGTIMALASITVTTGVEVHGRALAQTGAVTLDSDVFTALAC